MSIFSAAVAALSPTKQTPPAAASKARWLFRTDAPPIVLADDALLRIVRSERLPDTSETNWLPEAIATFRDSDKAKRFQIILEQLAVTEKAIADVEQGQSELDDMLTDAALSSDADLDEALADTEGVTDGVERLYERRRILRTAAEKRLLELRSDYDQLTAQTKRSVADAAAREYDGLLLQIAEQVGPLLDKLIAADNRLRSGKMLTLPTLAQLVGTLPPAKRPAQQIAADAPKIDAPQLAMGPMVKLQAAGA